MLERKAFFEKKAFSSEYTRCIMTTGRSAVPAGVPGVQYVPYVHVYGCSDSLTANYTAL